MTEGKLLMKVRFLDAEGNEDVQTFIVKLGFEFKPAPGCTVLGTTFIEVGNN